jgi:hypothetical protein
MPQLINYNNETLGITLRGIGYSTNNGRSWNRRYSGSSCGEFRNLADGGKELLANTGKVLFFSTNCERSWIRRM